MSLRAGHAFATALLIVAEEMAQPLSKEFRQVYDEQNYGKPLPDVLKGFTECVPLSTFESSRPARLSARRQPAEVLDKLSGVIRERFGSNVKSGLSAHGRITGWVLAVLPPAVALFLYSIAPDHVMLLVRDPIAADYRGCHHPPDHRNPRDPAHREGRVLDRGERRCLQS